MLRRSPVLLSCALVTALVACDCSGGTPDAGQIDDDGGLGVIVDAGADGGTTDDDGGAPGDDAGQDAGPALSDAEIAQRLCLAYRRGLDNRDRQLAALAPPARCSNTDPLPDVGDDLALPLGSCGVQDPLREMFATALAGGRVDIDHDLFTACVANGRAMRTGSAARGDSAARAAGITALIDDADCSGAVTPLVTTAGSPCEQAWDCAAPLRCEADPIDGTTLSCLAGAAVGDRCDDVAVGDQVPLRTCRDGTACVLGFCTDRLNDGDACETTADAVPCAVGSVCLTTDTCGPPGGETAPCARGDQCADGLVCDGASSQCVTATPLLDDGEVCTADSECALPCSVCRPDGAGALRCADRASAAGTCAATDHCRVDLHCVADGGVCQPVRALFEPCGPTAPCGEQLVCTNLPRPDPPPPPDAGAGDAGANDAGSADAGAVDGGPVGFVCRGYSNLGQGCQRNGLYRCAEGACVGGVCVAGDIDDPCIADSDCEDDAFCVVNVCVRKPREDAPCTSDGRCADGLVCTDDRCQQLPAAGEPCTPDERCGDGAFCEVPDPGPDGGVVDAGPRCETTRPPGDACTDDAQCDHGRCLASGTCGAEAASCLTTRETFAQLVGLSLLLPLAGRLRRRRRA
jgi:hypothetical protein